MIIGEPLYATMITTHEVTPFNSINEVADKYPDFVKMADAYGVPGRKVTKREDCEAAFQFAHETPGPVLLEFVVEMEEAVYPMVPAGADLDDMIRRPIRRKVAPSD